MSRSDSVLVYGATGHTGRFVTAELVRRGLTPVLAGRALDHPRRSAGYDDLEQRHASVDEADALLRAMDAVSVVVNCAGPFLDTALPLARAAVDSGAHYLDVTAEQQVVRDLYAELDAPARSAGVAVVPAMAFYGGLPDLLITAALEGGSHIDEVDVAVGLDRWWPTAGTRATGARNTARRLTIRDGRLSTLEDPASTRTWRFSTLLGDQPVVELPFSEVVTIERHLHVGNLHSYLNLAPLEDLRDVRTPTPPAVDEQGRSAQQFIVEVLLRRGCETRRVTAVGRDIYATTAPLVVEGVVQLLEGRHRGPGAGAPGEAFDAAQVLRSMGRHVALTTGQWSLGDSNP